MANGIALRVRGPAGNQRASVLLGLSWHILAYTLAYLGLSYFESIQLCHHSFALRCKPCHKRTVPRTAVSLNDTLRLASQTRGRLGTGFAGLDRDLAINSLCTYDLRFLNRRARLGGLGRLPLQVLVSGLKRMLLGFTATHAYMPGFQPVCAPTISEEFRQTLGRAVYTARRCKDEKLAGATVVALKVQRASVFRSNGSADEMRSVQISFLLSLQSAHQGLGAPFCHFGACICFFWCAIFFATVERGREVPGLGAADKTGGNGRYGALWSVEGYRLVYLGRKGSCVGELKQVRKGVCRGWSL